MVKKKEKETDRIKSLKQKSRNLSIKEGIYASAKGSFGDQYLTPFAIAINSTNSLVAMLHGISGILGPISQIFSSKLIEKTTRKKIVTKSVLFESFIWILFVLVGILYIKQIIISSLPLLFIFFFAVYISISNIMVPAWFSWTGDLIHERYRGRWISKRNMLIGFSTFILLILSSLFLEYMKKNDKTILGFCILFSLAFLMRIRCFGIFKKQYEPKIILKEISEKTKFTFWDFLIKSPKTNFGHFSIFGFFFNLSIAMSSSLIGIYLLRDLELSYVSFMVIISSATIFSLIATEIWGKIADKYGNYKVLVISTTFIPLIPLAWILHTSVLYLILVPGIIRGISWAGYNLASVNFFYDNVSPEKRGKVISYYHFVIGFGTFIGAIIGAFLINVIKSSPTKSIMIIFIASALLGMIVVGFFVPKIKEIKKKSSSRNPKNFRKFLVKTIKPSIQQEVHQIIDIKRYLSG